MHDAESAEPLCILTLSGQSSFQVFLTDVIPSLFPPLHHQCVEEMMLFPFLLLQQLEATYCVFCSCSFAFCLSYLVASLPPPLPVPLPKYREQNLFYHRERGCFLAPLYPASTGTLTLVL